MKKSEFAQKKNPTKKSTTRKKIYKLSVWGLSCKDDMTWSTVLSLTLLVVLFALKLINVLLKK